MKRILNLTQHLATHEQKAVGVFDLDEWGRKEIANLLTFDTPPTPGEMMRRAYLVAELAGEVLIDNVFEEAMIGGAPFFMPALEAALAKAGLIPVYAFSRRQSVEKTLDDGTVRKIARFSHAGFVKGGLCF